jgi:hypothetical protein
VQAALAAFTDEDRVDTISVVSVIALLGSASGDDRTQEVMAGLCSFLIYFVSKLNGRQPARALTDLLAPD